jgi:PAS domain S-box-containing protein
MLGYENEKELLGEPVLKIAHPKYKDVAYQRIQTMIKTGKPAPPIQEKVLKKDGTEVDALVTAAPITYEGKPAIEVAAMDISELKRAEWALSDSEIKFRTLFEESRDAIMFTTLDGRFVDFNKATESLLGYDRDELLNLPAEKMYAKEEDRQKFIDLIQSQGFVENYELELRKKDGSVITCLDTASVRKDNNGNIVGYQGIVRDITSRVESEQIVKKLSKVVENSPDVIFITDPDGRIEYVNPAFKKVTGYKDKEALGKTPRILKSGRMNDKYYRKLWDTILSGNPFHSEVINKKKNGELFVYDEFITPLFDKNGSIINFISVGTDITEKKKAERELKESEARFRTLFEESQDAILITSPDGRFLDFNKAATDLLGYTEEEMHELPVTELYVNIEDRRRYRAVLEEKGSLKDVELQFKKKDGTVIDIIASASVHRDKNGNIISFRTILRDITERNRARRELKEALEQAQEGERVKTLFLANMSHEIRTPLNAILGYTELLEASTAHMVSEEEQVFFDAVKNNCNRLMGTVHEILDMSQIDAGTFKTHMKQHDLVELMEIATMPLRKKAEEAGLEFKVRSTTQSAPIIADEYCVIQSISNVVENAIKYTPKGKVEVILKGTRSTYNVMVKDTGVGIAKSNIEEIFKEFKQESEGYTKQYQGVGLGLSLVKKYMDLCNAKIFVNSKKGVGTTFTLKFSKCD